MSRCPLIRVPQDRSGHSFDRKKAGEYNLRQAQLMVPEGGQHPPRDYRA